MSLAPHYVDPSRADPGIAGDEGKRGKSIGNPRTSTRNQLGYGNIIRLIEYNMMQKPKFRGIDVILPRILCCSYRGDVVFTAGRDFVHCS